MDIDGGCCLLILLYSHRQQSDTTNRTRRFPSECVCVKFDEMELSDLRASIFDCYIWRNIALLNDDWIFILQLKSDSWPSSTLCSSTMRRDAMRRIEINIKLLFLFISLIILSFKKQKSIKWLAFITKYTHRSKYRPFNKSTWITAEMHNKLQSVG